MGRGEDRGQGTSDESHETVSLLLPSVPAKSDWVVVSFAQRSVELDMASSVSHLVVDLVRP